MPVKRLGAGTRRKAIIAAATKLAQRHGYTNITREAVAVEAACSPATVSVYFPLFGDVKRMVLKEAIATSNLTILAQGLAARDRVALRAPDELKKKAIATLFQ